MADYKYALDNVFLTFTTLVDIIGNATRTYAATRLFASNPERLCSYSYERVGEEPGPGEVFARHGERPKKRSPLFLKTVPNGGWCIFGAACRAVVVPIDALLNENGIEHIINESVPQSCSVPWPFMTRSGDLGPRIKGIKEGLLFDQVETARCNCFLMAKAVRKGGRANVPCPKEQKKTNRPPDLHLRVDRKQKGVMLSHWTSTRRCWRWAG
jgi:hypothetical protein